MLSHYNCLANARLQFHLGSSTNQGTDTQASTQTLVCSDATSTDETNDEIKIESQPIFSTYGPNSNELSQLFDGTHADINPDQSGSVDLTQYCILIGDLVGDTSNNTVSVPALVKAENKEGACEEENGPKYGLIDCIMIGSTVPLPMASTSDGLVKREHDVVSGDIPYIVTVRLVQRLVHSDQHELLTSKLTFMLTCMYFHCIFY